MRRILALFMILATSLLCFGFTASAEGEYDTYEVGEFVYKVPQGWKYQANSTNNWYYHYANIIGSPAGGFYYVSISDLILDDTTIKVGFQAFADSMFGVEDGSSVLTWSTLYGYKCATVEGIMHVDSESIPALVFLISDSSHIVCFTYSNTSADSDELHAQFDELVNMITVKGMEPINISGSGTEILNPVTIDNVPTRIIYSQSEPGEFDVSCIYNDENYSLIDSSYNEDYGIELTNKAGEYVFMVETGSDLDWTLRFESLTDADFSPLSMHGDCVSDIYTFDGPCVIRFSAKFADFENLFLDAYIETDDGWDKEYLLNELESAGYEGEYSKILKIAGPTRVFFKIDFDAGDWTLDIGE